MQFNQEDNTVTLDTFPLSKAVSRMLEAQRQVIGTVTSMEEYEELDAALLNLANEAVALHMEIKALQNFVDQDRLQ